MNTFTSILADSHNWNHMGNWDRGWMWVWGTLMMLGFLTLIVWLACSAKSELETDEYSERLAELDRVHSA
jgi:hypothetical protein